MDTNDTRKSPLQNTTDNAAFSLKKVPHVVILPDGTKPLPLGSGTITSILGIGGMSNVYEIWNSHLEVKRVVKLLHPNYSLDSKQRFETEIKITAKLNHPNIVEIHAVGEWNALPYIEMEKVDGCTIDKLIADRGCLPVEVCTSIGILIGRALTYAHNHEYALYGQTYHGIIHRDLKPNNIMVSNSGVVKLMDFGVARPIDASIHTTDNSSVLGTMQYLSPELLEGKSADIRTDIYSLSSVLYESITGTKAFPESNISTLMMHKIKNEYRPLDSFAIRIPAKLKRLVQKGMNRDREKRPSSSDELIVELTKIHKSVTSLSPEAVMNGFVNTETNAKTIVSLKRQYPVKQAASFVAILLFCVGAIMFIRNVKTHSHKKTPETAAVINEPALQQALPVKQQKPIAAKSQKSRLSTVTALLLKDPSEKPTDKKNLAGDLLLSDLKQQYGTDDLAEIFIREVKAGHLQQAQKIFILLSLGQKTQKSVILFHLRMLESIQNFAAASQVLASQVVEDGEFFLMKARQSFRENNSIQCLLYLDLASKTRCDFLSPASLRQEILYYKALCYGKEFDAHPSQATLKNALDSWFEVKLLFRTTPEHNYFQKAVLEMQRIGEKGKEIRG